MFLTELTNSQDTKRMGMKLPLTKLTERELLELTLTATLTNSRTINKDQIYNSLSGMKL